MYLVQLHYPQFQPESLTSILDRIPGVKSEWRGTQRRKLRGFPRPVAPQVSRVFEVIGTMRQAPSRGAEGVSSHTGVGIGVGKTPFSRGQALPGYGLDFDVDEAIWGWAREKATGNLCLGSKAAVQERVDSLLSGLVIREEEVKRRCWIVL